MLQICDKTICKSIILDIFSGIESGIFPNIWEIASVTPIHQRAEKNNVKSYHLGLLFPIFGKICERLKTMKFVDFFIENSLIFPNKSSFKQGDSYINKILSITHIKS